MYGHRTVAHMIPELTMNNLIEGQPVNGHTFMSKVEGNVSAEAG